MSDIIDNDEIQQSQNDKLNTIIKLLRVIVAQNEDIWGTDITEDDVEDENNG